MSKLLKLVAVTGGIGSGKSSAMSSLKNAGYCTLSCDEITAWLYKKRKTKLMLKSLFPTGVKGRLFLTIDRSEISKQAFSNKEKHLALTKTITPLVMNEVVCRAKKLGGTVFVEVPLLFECDYQKFFDAVIVIMRDIKQRIDSVIERSKLTKEQVEARIKNQVDYDAIDLSPYLVVENNGDKTSLEQNILSLAKTIYLRN